MPGIWDQGPFDIGNARPRLQMPPIRGLSVRNVAGVVIGVLVVLLLLTSFYQVESDEVAVIQRFGKFVGTADPGLHFKLPLGIEIVTKVPIQRQLKMEFGFRTLRSSARTEYAPPTAETQAEAIMLTGDLNVAVVEWIVQYKIRDARSYLFNVRNVRETFHYMSEASVRKIVGDHSVDEVLTIGRETIAQQAKEELQRLCNNYGIGIEIQQLVLQDVNPPDPVRPAFNEVNQAIQEKERAINEAWAEYNKAVPRAKGEAEQAVRAAEGYLLDRVNSAEGDAKRFEAFYEEYRKAPAVTRKRLYLETMATLLPKMGKKVVIDEKTRGLVPLLSLEGATKEVKP